MQRFGRELQPKLEMGPGPQPAGESLRRSLRAAGAGPPYDITSGSWEDGLIVHATDATPADGLAARPPWRTRVAAVVALLAPVAMAVVAAVALAGDLAIAVLAVGLVLVASAAIWFALTRRGPRRAAGAALAALAGAGLIVVLATHWQGVLVLVALLLLARRVRPGRALRAGADRGGGGSRGRLRSCRWVPPARPC